MFALVPGKQDFYFGPERIRELARFMATGSQFPARAWVSRFTNDGEGVQMLGAKYCDLKPHGTLLTRHCRTAKKLPPWFIPRPPSGCRLS